MMHPLHSNAGHGHHLMPGMHLLRPEESTAITGLNMMATGSPNPLGALKTAAASASVGPLSQPVASVAPPEFSGHPEPFAPSSSAGHSTQPGTSSSVAPPDIPGSLALAISTTKSLHDPSHKPAADQLESSSLHTETQSVAINTMKLSTKPTNAGSKGDTKGLPRNKPGVASNRISPHNQYNSKGRTKAYSLFGKFSEVKAEINARVEQQMREHNYDYTKRVALLNKERQAEFEKLPAEEQQSWIKRMEMENESARGLTEDFEERMSTIGHRLSLIHEDTYEAAGVPIMSVIFRPPNGIDRASAHIMQAAGPFSGFTTWLEEKYNLHQKVALLRFLDDYANYLFSLVNELKPSFTVNIPTPPEFAAPDDSAIAQDPVEEDQELNDKKKRRKSKGKLEAEAHLGPVWRNGIQRILDPWNLDVARARRTLRKALIQRWEAVGRQGRMIFSYIEDTPWEYLRDNSLPPGIHLKKIEHIPLEHIKRLLDHLRSLETDETYEDGLIFIPKYEGLPKVRHRKSKKQKLVEMDRLQSLDPRGSHESEQESESEEKPSPSAPATTLPTTEVNGPQMQRNAAPPEPEGRLIDGNMEQPDFDPTSSNTDTTQTTHPPHSQSKLPGSTPMNTPTVIELGSSCRQPDVSSHSSLPPTCSQSGVNPNQLSFTLGPGQSGEYAGLSFGSNGGSSSMHEKTTQLSRSLPFQAALPSQSTPQGTMLSSTSDTKIELNGQGVENSSTSAPPRREYSEQSGTVGDIPQPQPPIASRTGSPRSMGNFPPPATIASSPDNAFEEEADVNVDQPSKTPPARSTEEAEGKQEVDPSLHLNPPPPPGQDPAEQGEVGPSHHPGPPPPPAGQSRKGSKKPTTIKTSADVLKQPAKRGTPKVLDNPRPATRSITSKKRPHEDSQTHPNKRRRM